MRQGIFATTIGVAVMATAIAAGATPSTGTNNVKQVPPPTTEPSGIASPSASPMARPVTK